MSKTNGKEVQPTFYIKDPTRVTPTVLVDPNDKYWQPKDHRTKKRTFEYGGGMVGGAEFEPGWYIEDINNLVVIDEADAPIDDVADYDNLSDETHAAGSHSSADLVTAGADNTTRGPIDD